MACFVSLDVREPPIGANGSGVTDQLEHMDNTFPGFCLINCFANSHGLNERRATAMTALDSLFQLMSFAFSHNTPRTAKIGSAPVDAKSVGAWPFGG
jgi:hypothetical protein